MLVCPHDSAFDFAALSRRFGREVPLGEEGHAVEPFSFLLGWTVERIQLPHTARLAARVEGKSSLARLGLGVHVPGSSLKPRLVPATGLDGLAKTRNVIVWPLPGPGSSPAIRHPGRV